MKLSKISRAVAGLAAVAAAPAAFALGAASYTNTSEFVGDTVNYRVSGATAQDPGLIAAVLRFCQAGTIDRFSISNNAVIFCTGNGIVGLPAGASKIAVYKYSQGGSANGVTPLNSGTATLPFLDLTKIAASCAAGTNVATVDPDGTGPLPSYTDATCSAGSTALTTSVVSYVGISDVEPSFFGGPSTYNNIASTPLATVIFGVPVTKNIYEALQNAQGLGTCVTGSTSTTAPDLTEACMPTLSSAQVTAMYTQVGQSWSSLTGATAGDDLVYVARRADSSGTQKTAEALIARTANGTATGKSCQPASHPFVSGPAAADNTAANTLCTSANLVVNNSGSGQVLACMNAHQNGGRAAIGVLSTEFKSAQTGLIRFVKVNMKAPTQANVASGQYTLYADASINQRLIAPTTAGARGYANFVTQLKQAFGDPAIISVINGTPQPFGASGLMALAELQATIPSPPDLTGANGLNPWTRSVGGTDLNNCAPGILAGF